MTDNFWKFQALGAAGVLFAFGCLVLLYLFLWKEPSPWFYLPMSVIGPAIGLSVGYHIGLRRYCDTGLFWE